MWSLKQVQTTPLLSQTLLTEYVLTPATSGNIGERFTWNSIDVGVPTNLSYDLEKIYFRKF